MDEKSEENESLETGTEYTTESGLEFDPEVVKAVGNSASSLEDIYGYPVFSDYFTDRIEHAQIKEKKEVESAFKNVFTEEMQSGIDEAFTAVMTADMESVITVNYNRQNGERESAFSIVGFTVLGMVITTVIILVVDSLRKKSRKSGSSKRI